MEDDKEFFNCGDKVVVNKLPGAPTMYVIRKEMSQSVKPQIFLGIRCGWFDKVNNFQEAVFNTKDLTKL